MAGPATRAADPTRLLEEVASEANLARALLNVVRNKGAPGIDGQTVEEAEAQAPRLLADLRRDLLAGRFCPGDIRRVWLPKPGGGERGLGIPNVATRVVQQAVLQGLEPIYEPTFHSSSHGFRPDRGAHTAIAEATGYLEAGFRTVVDLDLAKFFDRVHHQRLLDRMSQRVTDRRILDLVRRMLKAAVVMPDGTRVAVVEAAPQGGPLTPPTILQNTAWSVRRVGPRWVMSWLDAENDVHVLPIDFNPLHEQTDQFAALLPIRCSETILNAIGKLFEPPDDERQGAPLCSFVTHGIGLRLPSLDPLSEAGKPRFELTPLNQAFGIAVDQSVHAAP